MKAAGLASDEEINQRGIIEDESLDLAAVDIKLDRKAEFALGRNSDVRRRWYFRPDEFSPIHDDPGYGFTADLRFKASYVGNGCKL